MIPSIARLVPGSLRIGHPKGQFGDPRGDPTGHEPPRTSANPGVAFNSSARHDEFIG